MLFADNPEVPTTVLGFLWALTASLLGAVLYYLRHLITVTIPDKDKEHRAAMMELVTGWRTAIGEMVSAHREKIKELNEVWMNELAEQRNARLQQHTDNREDHRAQMAANQALSILIENGLRDNRHAIRNLEMPLQVLLEMERGRLGMPVKPPGPGGATT